MTALAKISPAGTLRQFAPAEMQVIRRTVAKDCTDAEFNLFMSVCSRTGLDPFRKQIYAAVYGRGDKRSMTIITGIDGMRAIAARSGRYRPDENEPELVYDEAAKDKRTNPLGLVKAVVTAYVQDDAGVWYPVKGVAYWDEYATAGQSKWSNKWDTMGRVMLAKCAEAQALRRGWPEDLSGLYAAEEMDQAAEEIIDATATEVVERADADDRARLVGGRDVVTVIWAPGQPLETVPVGQYADRAVAFIQGSEEPGALRLWWESNLPARKAHWSASPGDALAVKRAYEARLAELMGDAA